VELAIMTGRSAFFPYIDYLSHPAYRDFAVKRRFDDAEVDGRIADIDAALAALRDTRYTDDALAEPFNRGPGARIDDLEDYLVRNSPSARISDWFSRSFENTRIELLEEARVANWRTRLATPSTLDNRAQAVASGLCRDGVYTCKLEPETREQLRKLCASRMNELREKSKENPTVRLVHTYVRLSKVGIVLEKFFERQGIIDGLRRYVESNVEFEGFALEYSHERQRWWRGLYADVGLPESRTSYMHYDHGARDPKAIVALSDVSVENGPTSFVLGSHRAERSRFLHAMVKALDHCFSPDPSLPHIENYYRDRFSKPEYRREFLQQPAAFLACSHFGDDIIDDTELSRDLLSREMTLTQEVGNCIVFDGNYGIHRGALVKRGERFVFQIIFRIAPRLPWTERTGSRLRGMMLRNLGRYN
jgi:hypothetical protein